jgi:hypothetical protein
MTTLSKQEFVRRHKNDQFDVDDMRGLSRASKSAVARADVNNDGVIQGSKEVGKLFDAIDAVDRNGSRQSVNLGSRGRPTPARAALQKVENAATPRRGLSGGVSGNAERAEGERGVSGSAGASMGQEGVANIDRVVTRGRSQRVQGTITVNGNSYTFNSGGSGNGSCPPGVYTVTRHRDRRSDNAGMMVGREGYSFAMSDKYDPRVGAKRSLLRIHPDGRGPGTEGCIGIVGDEATQRAFRRDMLLALRQNGGRYQLRVA